MMMVRVTDHSLRVALLTHLIEQLKRGDLAPLLEKGACPKSMDRLLAMSIGDLLMMVETGYPDIHFSIDANGFDLGILTLDRQKEEADDLTYFFRHGASQSVIDQMFPNTSACMIQSYRKLLKPYRKAGRATLPDAQSRDRIHQCWAALPAEYPQASSMRAKLRLMHETLNTYSIDVLYATVNEFNPTQAQRKAHG